MVRAGIEVVAYPLPWRIRDHVPHAHPLAGCELAKVADDVRRPCDESLPVLRNLVVVRIDNLVVVREWVLSFELIEHVNDTAVHDLLQAPRGWLCVFDKSNGPPHKL